ncbi:ATP-binding protein [Methylomonas sp. 2B]
MSLSRRYLPRTLRRQFLFTLAALAALILAGGLTAVHALRGSANTVAWLAEERLESLRQAQQMVDQTLQIERASYQLARTGALAPMRASYADIAKRMEIFDVLVDKLAAGGEDAALLDLRQASQLFRNTANVVAQLRESAVRESLAPQDVADSAARHRVQQEFDEELRRQATAMVDAARTLNDQYTEAYRNSVRELWQTARDKEHWVEILLAGSLLLAWTITQVFVGRHVLARLQHISRQLREDHPDNATGSTPRSDLDEIDEMAQAVAQFREDRRQLALRTEELARARDAAESANKAKSAFLANMSHELRTPLSAILGFSSMLRDDPELSESQLESLDIINRSGEHLLDLINDVLEIAKIEAGQLKLTVAPFDLGGLVRDVTDMMQARASAKGLRLGVDQSSEFPRFIKADQARLRQILVNLIGNALKFTPAGGVTVRLATLENHRQHLLMTVEDTGSGIAPEDQQRLFEPFVQLADNGDQKGTGLGLAITRQFVELMGGRISVTSTPGKGSLFSVDVPVELVADEAFPVSLTPRSGAAIRLAPGQPAYRILIADDQIENQILLRQLMNRLGLETRIAGNGQQCLDLCRDWQPDLIWMDRRMPVLDGVEATRQIRRLPGGNRIKIIAVTASAFREEQQEMLDAGMDDFIPKPYRFQEIYDCLARHLGLEFVDDRLSNMVEPPANAPIEDSLADLPAPLRLSLRQALESLDAAQIAAAISQIGIGHAALAERLAALAANFDYPGILKLLDTADLD